jgi:hypothetical protein
MISSCLYLLLHFEWLFDKVRLISTDNFVLLSYLRSNAESICLILDFISICGMVAYKLEK